MNSSLLTMILAQNSLASHYAAQRKIKDLEDEIDREKLHYKDKNDQEINDSFINRIKPSTRKYKKIETDVYVYDEISFTSQDGTKIQYKLSSSNVKQFDNFSIIEFEYPFQFTLMKNQILDSVNNYIPIELSNHDKFILSKLNALEIRCVPTFCIVTNDDMTYLNDDGSFGRTETMMSDMETMDYKILRVHSSCEFDEEIQQLEELLSEPEIINEFISYYFFNIKFDVTTRKETHVLEIPMD